MKICCLCIWLFSKTLKKKVEAEAVTEHINYNQRLKTLPCFILHWRDICYCDLKRKIVLSWLPKYIYFAISLPNKKVYNRCNEPTPELSHLLWHLHQTCRYVAVFMTSALLLVSNKQISVWNHAPFLTTLYLSFDHRLYFWMRQSLSALHWKKLNLFSF